MVSGDSRGDRTDRRAAMKGQSAASQGLSMESSDIPLAPVRQNHPHSSERPALLDLSHADMADILARKGQPSFRVTQLRKWIYQDLAADFSEMSNLPRSLRQDLGSEYALWPVSLDTYTVSRSGDTLKGLFRLPDGECVEAVLMLYDRRQTLCISSQAGCAMGCSFCATGLDGLTRNLTPGEIVGQALALARLLARRKELGLDLAASNSHVSNIVFMGMGEPLHNYRAVWSAIRTLCSADGFGMSPRHVTVSTVGLTPRIREMAEEGASVRLAVSLHAPNDELRSRIVPPSRRWPLGDLLEASRFYAERSGRRVTFEYVMLRDLNDAPELGAELGRRLRGLNSHVNLIPYNPIPGDPHQPSSEGRTREFAAAVRRHGVSATIRVRRGIEMEAGCGQLRRRVLLDLGTSREAGRD